MRQILSPAGGRPDPSAGAPADIAPVNATVWSLAGFAAQRGLRIGGNLILTRLLFPEAFGLMAIVQVVQQGLEMASDIGVSASVVRDRHGEERAFLDTAWTVQVLRGATLWLASLAFAGPLAQFYEHPELAALIRVTCINLIIASLASPALMLLRRRMVLKPVIALECVAQSAAILVMGAAAWHWESVWALVAGSLTRVAAITLGSYALRPRIRPRLHLDRASWRRIAGFGRWIVFSTALVFFARQGDSAIAAKLIDPATFGCYSLALMIVASVFDAAQQLGNRVLIPALARAHAGSEGALRAQLIRIRRLCFAVFLPPTLLLVAFGPELVDFLYDPRYSTAGWMLQILACGLVGSIATLGQSSVLIAVGNSFRHMVLQATRAAFLLGCVLIGASLAGTWGLVLGAAVSKLLDYPMAVLLTRRYGIWTPALDAVVLLGCAAIVVKSLVP